MAVGSARVFRATARIGGIFVASLTGICPRHGEAEYTCSRNPSRSLRPLHRGVPKPVPSKYSAEDDLLPCRAFFPVSLCLVGADAGEACHPSSTCQDLASYCAAEYFDGAGLAVRMAIENEGWGYTRIPGEFTKLGYQVSRSAVRRILRAQGIEPAPERLKRMPWSKCLKAHWQAIAAADFFTVEVWSSVPS